MRFTLLLIGVFACSDHTINEIKPSTPGAGETGFEDTGFRPVEPVCPIEQSWTFPSLWRPTCSLVSTRPAQ